MLLSPWIVLLWPLFAWNSKDAYCTSITKITAFKWCASVLMRFKISVYFCLCDTFSLSLYLSAWCVIVAGKNHIKSHFENSIFKWNVCFLLRHLSFCGISLHCSTITTTNNNIPSSARMHCIFKAQKVIEFYTLSFKKSHK